MAVRYSTIAIPLAGTETAAAPRTEQIRAEGNLVSVGISTDSVSVTTYHRTSRQSAYLPRINGVATVYGEAGRLLDSMNLDLYAGAAVNVYITVGRET